MTKAQLLHHLTQLVGTHGSQRKTASALGISPQYLNDILLGHREPSTKLLQALGMRRADTTYVSVAAQKDAR
jgi:transcriptional regulator with XRE-family HTH domain